MMDKYADMIREIALFQILAPYDKQALTIWEKIKDDTIHDTLCYMADNDKENVDRDSLALIVGQVLANHLSLITPNQYQELAMRTCSIRDTSTKNPNDISIPMLTNAMLGLCGETGECADLVKKHLYQGHGLDKAHMAKELGDVAWYLAEAAEGIGYNLEDIFRMNIDKLKARYPEGHFDSKCSQHRKEDDV